MISNTIQCNELAKKLASNNHSSLKILFTTMVNSPIAKPELLNDGGKSFLPNSLLFDFENEFVDLTSALSNMMPSSALFELHARKLGLHIDDEIIIYDDLDNFCSSRAWFMLLSMGFKNVKVLEGGLSAWIRGAYKTQESLSTPSSTSLLKVEPSTDYTFVNADYIQHKLADFQKQNSQLQIIDARSPGRFAGLEPEPRQGMRAGHIPHSINIHYSSLLKNGLFETLDVLKGIFVKKGVDMNTEIITSCGSGVTACIIALAAHSLGAPYIRVYDGSWSEWGASQSLPIEVNK